MRRIIIITALAATGCATTTHHGPPPSPDHVACEPGPVTWVEVPGPVACDLVAGRNTLNIVLPGYDGVDDAAARADAADHGCADFEVRDGVATGIDCDF